ncbi:MAG: tocopherol cyclase, partial [Acaryochloridaceae cyanobacterium CSU_5_19]|nr:tocopherol cyclase [Acaryochloridaceae cyanobacterium CSU_5_19]
NCFIDQSDLALTAAGGRRQILSWMESVGLMGLHHQGQFYEFAPWNAKINWQVSPWGEWWMEARNATHHLELWATCDRPGKLLRAPTQAGLVYICRDTMFGHLKLRLKRLHPQGSALILQANSKACGLEVGGQPWQDSWIRST